MSGQARSALACRRVRPSLRFPGLMLAVSLMALSALPQVASAADNSELFRKLQFLGDVIERIRNDYVDAPDTDRLIAGAVNGMLSSLDPHSTYIDPKNYKDMQIHTRAQFAGLGFEMAMEDGSVKVVSAIDGTPSSRAGILPGDLITAMDHVPVQGMTLNQAVEKMRGPVNSEITLTIVRKGKAKAFDVTLVREFIVVRSVKGRIVSGDVGYIRITQFTEQTLDGLREEIGKIGNEVGRDKLKGYILDLRNDPGGLIDQAVAVSDAFLERGEIVSTRGRKVEEFERYTAKPGDLANGKPIVILVNGGTAGGPEIVAGALQDQQRATIVGTRTFGMGTVQTILPLGANGAIRLTTARYYTPAGRSIQAAGIEPDFIVEQNIPDDLKGADKPRGESSLKGRLTNESAPDAESGSSAYVPANAKDDAQLQFALQFVRAKKKK